MKQDTILTKAIIGLLLAVIVAYLVLSGFKTMADPYKLVAVYNDVVESSVTLNSWAFREEAPLEAANGRVSYRVDEGEKAAAGQLLASSYSNQEALMHQQKIREKNSQYSQLEFARAIDSPSEQSLETQIIDSLASLQGAASKGDFTRLPQQADTHKGLVLRREYLTSETASAEMGNASLALSQELTAVQNTGGQEAQMLYAPFAGVFSSYVDGYEQIFQPALLQDISPETLKALIAQAPQPDNNSIGKLISSMEWYIALLVPEAQLPMFQKQTNVSVRSASMREAIPMEIRQVGYVENGEAVVLLASRKGLTQVLGLREQTISVIFRSEEGIRIPKTALRVQEDGATVVYTVAGYRAEIKPVTVVAEDKDDYIVTANPKDNEDKRVLRSGDEVIISAEELYQGKVVR